MSFAGCNCILATAGQPKLVVTKNQLSSDFPVEKIVWAMKYFLAPILSWDHRTSAANVTNKTNTDLNQLFAQLLICQIVKDQLKPVCTIYSNTFNS